MLETPSRENLRSFVAPTASTNGSNRFLGGWLVKVQPKAPADSGTAVYLDYAATTPVAPEVVKEMHRFLGADGIFGNPSSRLHRFGRAAKEAVERARTQVADLIGASPREIYWTSGATESINLAIKGMASANAHSGKRHLVTSSLEHKAVIDTCHRLEREGVRVTFLEPDSQGLICPEKVRAALTGDTFLVSLMHVNNEVGTVTDIGAIAQITHARGIAFHVDAAQSAARLPLDTNGVMADLISLSGHKMYGPKGVGALYIRSRRNLRIEPQMHGGDQERGMRSGTLPTHQLVGMGAAAELCKKRRHRDVKTVTTLDAALRAQLGTIESSYFNGNQEYRIPGILNVGFYCVDGESLLMSMPQVALSSGSACTTSRIESSHVLLALGVPEELASYSVRFSVGRYTRATEIDSAVSHVRCAVDALRQISPSWEALKTQKIKNELSGAARGAMAA